MQTKICNLSILPLSENENSVHMFTETLHNLEDLFFEKDIILEKNGGSNSITHITTKSQR